MGEVRDLERWWWMEQARQPQCLFHVEQAGHPQCLPTRCSLRCVRPLPSALLRGAVTLNRQQASSKPT